MKLLCEYMNAPVGIEEPMPFLSWISELEQNAYRIYAECDNGLLWDTGIVKSNQSVHIPYKGKPLQSGMIVEYKVWVWDNNGNSVSGESRWEMGLMHPSDWKAKWIKPSAYRTSWASLLRREFTVKKKVKRARAYICGLGYNELYINGAKIGDRVLDPVQSNYEKVSYYSVYDITDRLNTGENCAGIILGDGMYHQSKVWGRSVVYDVPKAILQFHIAYSDGSSEFFVSDKYWKSDFSPVTSNNVYIGETYDSRLEQDGWAQTGFNDKYWRSVQICESPAEKLSASLQGIKIQEEIRPVSFSKVSEAVHVFDMGINFTGWVRINIKGSLDEMLPGREVVLRYSEITDESGRINPDTCGTRWFLSPQVDRYIIRGDEYEIWQPRFTFHGFRYMELTGCPGEVSLETVTGIRVHSCVEPTCGFNCGDERIIKIDEMVKNTIRNNIIGLPSDCPAREKCGWLGDVVPIADTMLYNWNCFGFLKKYLMDIRTSAELYGVVQMVAPGKRTCGTAAPAWGMAQVTIPLDLYNFTGDIRVLAENFDHMKKWVLYLLSTAEDFVLNHGLDDWCPPYGIMGRTQTEISTIAFYISAAGTAEAARLLGFNSSEFDRLAGQIRNKINERYFDFNSCSYSTPAINALCLCFGIAPSGMEETAAKALRAQVEEGGFHFNVGHLGTKYVIKALLEHGYYAEVYKLFRQDEFPGFGYMIRKGATTLWEWWEYRESSETHPFQGGSASHNHPFKGGLATLFYSHILGIRPLKYTFKEILIAPCPIKEAGSAEGSYDSPYGKISSGWKYCGDKVIYTIEIPPNTTARIALIHRAECSVNIGEPSLENGRWCYYVPPGRYEFTA